MKGRYGWLAMLLAVSAAQAAPSGFSANYQRCMDSASTTVAMVGCVAQETQREDQRLNSAYKTAMARLAPAQQPLLRSAQRAWIAFRDADCQLAGQLTGGSIDRINAQMCLLQHTQARAEALLKLTTPDT